MMVWASGAALARRFCTPTLSYMLSRWTYSSQKSGVPTEYRNRRANAAPLALPGA